MKWLDLIVERALERPRQAIGIAALALLLPVVAWTSCRGSGSGRYAVSGRVTFAGKPVPNGRIVFEPDPAAGGRGPASYAEISGGRYRTEAGKGLAAGRHVVRIAGFEGTIDRERMDAAMLFPEFTTTIDLPARSSRQDFAVPGDGQPP